MTHFDLFSGYGGFTLALQKVYANNLKRQHISEKSEQEELSQGRERTADERGEVFCSPDGATALCDTVGFSEIDRYASAVLKYHWPNTKNYGDISKINWAEVPDFNLLTGGSPCQDLSIAGKRAGLEGARSGLFYEYMRAVREKKPKYFIWENVKGALSSNHGWDFAAVLNEMAEAGYSLWWQVLNAKDFGVPQNRERIFVVGFRDKPAPEVFFESNSNTETRLADGKISNASNREFGFKDISPSCLARDYKEPKIVQLNNPTHSNNRLYSEDGISPTLNTAQGRNRQPKIPVSCVNKGEKVRQNGRRFKTDEEPSFTLNTIDRQEMYDGSRIRRLTPIECSRLMGLPDDWLKFGIDEKDNQIEISDSQKYRLAGNGVVVNVVEEIIKALII